MKNWINNIPKEKLQRYLFVGVLVLVFVAFFISLTLVKPKEDPKPITPDPDPPINKPIDEVYETVLAPVGEGLIIVRKFYDQSADAADRINSLYKIGTNYTTSSGVSWAKENGGKFDVMASLSGTVKSVTTHPLYGYKVTLDHGNGIETYYSSINEVVVSVGQTVKQGDKLGVADINEYDRNLSEHVHFQIYFNGNLHNPLTVIGKKINEITKK